MKRLLYFWLLATLVGAGVMTHFDKPKPKAQVIYMSFSEHAEKAAPKGKRGQEFDVCVVDGRKLYLWSCHQAKRTIDEAVSERSEQ